MVTLNFKTRYKVLLSLFLGLLLLMPSQSLAAKGDGTETASKTSWWDVIPEPETSSPYYDSILYSPDRKTSLR